MMEWPETVWGVEEAGREEEMKSHECRTGEMFEIQKID